MKQKIRNWKDLQKKVMSKYPTKREVERR